MLIRGRGQTVIILHVKQPIWIWNSHELAKRMT